jgi:hypothetical protein
MVFPKCEYNVSDECDVSELTSSVLLQIMTSDMAQLQINADTKSVSMPEWLTEIKPQVATVPAECTLQSGESIFIPSGFLHAAIGAAFQGGNEITKKFGASLKWNH